MRRTRLRFANTFLIALVLVTGIAFLYMVRSFIIPILLAAVFSTLFFPLYERLVKGFRGWRPVASILTCLLLLLLLLLPFYFVIDLVVGEVRDLVPEGEEGRAELGQRVTEAVRGYVEQYNDIPVLPDFDLAAVDWGALASDSAGKITSLVTRTSRGGVQIIVTLFVTLFTMFYFFLDGPKLVERMRDLVPLESRHEDAIARRFAAVARATVRGTLVIAVIQGTLGALTLWIFGVSGVVLWWVVMVVMAIIPVTGVPFVLFPAALIQALQGNYGAALGIALVTVGIAQVDNLLRPRLVGRDAGMHDLLIFFSTLGGIITFGAMGFIVGPVLAAFLLSLLDIYAQEFQGALTDEKRGQGGHGNGDDARDDEEPPEPAAANS